MRQQSSEGLLTVCTVCMCTYIYISNRALATQIIVKLKVLTWRSSLAITQLILCIYVHYVYLVYIICTYVCMLQVYPRSNFHFK